MLTTIIAIKIVKLHLANKRFKEIVVNAMKTCEEYAAVESGLKNIVGANDKKFVRNKHRLTMC